MTHQESCASRTIQECPLAHRRTRPNPFVCKCVKIILGVWNMMQAMVGAAAQWQASKHWNIGTGTLECWNAGTLGHHRDTEFLKHWDTGTLEHWSTGTLQHRDTGTGTMALERWNVGTLEDWDTGTLEHTRTLQEHWNAGTLANGSKGTCANAKRTYNQHLVNSLRSCSMHQSCCWQCVQPPDLTH